MKITPCVVGAFQENSYLLVDETAKRAVLVDPGAEPERLIALVRDSGAVLEAIWLTHAHIDHIGAIAGVKRVWDVPVYLHPGGKPLFERAPQHAAMYGIPFDAAELPDRALADGDRLRCGSLEFDVIFTPGHAPGHVVIVGHGVMFSGDLLFAGSIGRTDLPLSDPVKMAESLARIRDIDPATIVYSGHGPATTIGIELANNVFLNGAVPLAKR